MPFTVTTRWGSLDDCVLSANRYADNNHLALSIFSISEGPVASLTVNLPNTKKYPENYAFLDINNFPEAEEVVSRLGIGQDTGRFGFSGFCVYPLWVFDLDAISALAEQGGAHESV